ncbi:MAG: DUF2891 domain-containing protein [Halolamina sp.]
MNLLDATDPETAVAGTADWFTDDVLTRLATHPLESVETEYPHVAGAVESLEDTHRPADAHPVFYGCFDWHSAVHSHWSLVRQLRLADEHPRLDDHPRGDEITESIDGRLTPENVADEVAYFDEHESFEKPYGWGWLLRLAAELHLWDDPRAGSWGDTLAPLEERIVELVGTEFLTQSRPFRVGTHANSAFALSCVLDYARVVGNDDLATDTEKTARRFYLGDEDAPVAYEPYGWDFLSPTLTEANLLRRTLEDDEFADWATAFLPDVTAAATQEFLDPVAVRKDSEEGIELHLVGLHVSKAWGLAAMAETFATNDAIDAPEQVRAYEQSAARHLTAGVEMAFTDEYAGSHWLSSFVLYLLTRNEAGIAPVK